MSVTITKELIGENGFKALIKEILLDGLDEHIDINSHIITYPYDFQIVNKADQGQ